MQEVQRPACHTAAAVESFPLCSLAYILGHTNSRNLDQQWTNNALFFTPAGNPKEKPPAGDPEKREAPPAKTKEAPKQ